MCVVEEGFRGWDDCSSPGILFWSFDLREVCPNGWVCVFCELSDLLFPVIGRQTGAR